MPAPRSRSTVGRPQHPRPVPLGEVLAAVSELTTVGRAGADLDASTPLTGATHDSRAVQPGDLYAALPGAKHHGSGFVSGAVANGAVAVLTDTEGGRRLSAREVAVPVLVVPDARAVLGVAAATVHGHPSRRLSVVGVTGTNGKTTVAHLLEAGLAADGRATALIGTLGTRVAGSALPGARTTPEATDLQALFALMVERGVSSVAMEVSSHALSLGRVVATAFAAAGFTNLSQDHLDFHGDMESYFQAKASLFQAPTDPDRPRVQGGAVCIEDAWGRRLAGLRPDLPTVGVGGDWYATDVVPSATGSRLRLRGPGVDEPASVALPGGVNVTNLVLAVALLAAVGVPVADAVRGAAAVPGVPGRLERVPNACDLLALVDYAHTPAAVAAVLAAVRPLTRGRLWVVLGCGGDRDADKRPGMGAAAAGGADRVLLTTDNPRSEHPDDILSAMLPGALAAATRSGAQVRVEPDRAAAIQTAVREAAPGDTVLVAGKGHETGQEVQGMIYPFDDREVLALALAHR